MYIDISAVYCLTIILGRRRYNENSNEDSRLFSRESLLMSLACSMKKYRYIIYHILYCLFLYKICSIRWNWTSLQFKIYSYERIMWQDYEMIKKRLMISDSTVYITNCMPNQFQHEVKASQVTNIVNCCSFSYSKGFTNHWIFDMSFKLLISYVSIFVNIQITTIQHERIYNRFPLHCIRDFSSRKTAIGGKRVYKNFVSSFSNQASAERYRSRPQKDRTNRGGLFQNKLT